MRVEITINMENHEKKNWRLRYIKEILSKYFDDKKIEIVKFENLDATIKLVVEVE